MTYAQFLILFVLPPIGILLFYFWRRPDPMRWLFALGAGVLILLALVYTTPWDNYLVATGVWNYPPDRVLATIGYVPIEEYSFFVLETILTSLWCYFLHLKWPIVERRVGGAQLKKMGMVLLAVPWLASFWLLMNDPTCYLGLILVWALPVVFLQWSVAANNLPANWKILAGTILVPTLYLSAADAFAVADGIWAISSLHTIGVSVAGLPIEEIIFFFLTNVMVGQGLILFIARRDIILLLMGRRSEA